MALTDFAAYKAQFKRPQIHQYYIAYPSLPTTIPLASAFVTSTAMYPMLVGGSSALTAPSTAAALGAASAGAWVKPKAGSGDMITVGALESPSLYGAGGLLIDRLSHQGGLSGTVTTTQTTNLPTAALTRYTSGVGVLAALEFYTAVGATDAVWTVVYTNQAGTGSRSSSFIQGVTPVAGAFLLVPLQGSDTGVRSVESVTLTPSTGTAGNFGITLFKPLVYLNSRSSAGGRPCDIFDLPGWNTPIDDDAFLQLLPRQGVDTGLPHNYMFMFGES